MAWFTVNGRKLAVVVLAAALGLPVSSGARAAQERVPLPCPSVGTQVIDAPPRPNAPTGDPVQRAIGGEQLATSGLALAANSPAPPAVSATSWVVADLDSGEVLGACGPHEYGAPASVQKLLLAAALIGKLDPQQIVTVTDADLQFEPGSSAAGLVEGGRYTVETLWLGLLLVSGNDAANVLARLGGGAAGEDGGVQEMNAQAARLGAQQTHAVTPSGLDAPDQYTSAYDLALIARACFVDPAFQRYALTKQAVIPAQPDLLREGFQIQNQNLLIDEYPGALGGKTGFTDLARHTYVGAAANGRRRLVVTLLGAENRPLQGWQQGAALLDWGFGLPAGASVGRLVPPADEGQVAVAAGPISTAVANSSGTRSSGLAIAIAMALTGIALIVVLRRRQSLAKVRARHRL